MKKLLSTIIGLAISSVTFAQAQTALKQDNSWFNHLDLAFTANTTGIGFDLAAPMTEWAQIRMGGSFMPKFKYKMTFGVEAGTYIYDPSLTPAENEKAKTELLNSNFKKMADVMESFTGMRPEPSVDMIGDPKMNNFKMLVDIFPLKKNRHWHVTTGFYYGGNTVAELGKGSERQVLDIGCQAVTAILTQLDESQSVNVILSEAVSVSDSALPYNLL